MVGLGQGGGGRKSHAPAGAALRGKRRLYAESGRFFVLEVSAPQRAQAVDFGRTNNPLFVERPEWLVQATCASAYIMCIFYVLSLYLAVTDSWGRGPLARVALPLFLGGKLYAISFYHYMEFTSHAPPPNLVPYWAAEGPYLLNMGLLLHKVVSMAAADGKGAKQQ